MMFHLILFQVLFILPVCILLISTPYWTRKTESFGVTITENMYNHPHIQGMRKRYAIHMSSVSVLLIFILIVIQYLLTLDEETAVLSSILGMSLLLIIGFVYYLNFHTKMKRFKKENVSTEDKKQVVVVQTTFYTDKKTQSNAWFLISFGIIVLTIIFTQLNYNLFPSKIPINFNLSGEATSWIKKSEATVLFIPLIQLYVLVIFMFTNMVIRTAKQQINSNNPEESLQRNMLFRRRWSSFLILVGTLTIALLSFTQYTLLFQVSKTILANLSISVIAFILLGSLFLSFKMGQGGSRIKIGNVYTIDHTSSLGDDDQFWKLGLFYVNKNDPSLFIEKRFGIGWSVNFARPLIWILFGILIGSSIMLSIFVS